MKTIQTTLVTLALLISFSTSFGQNLMMKTDVKTQRFGKEIFYKDANNNPLDGHYKIANERGNYSDIHFKKGKKDGEWWKLYHGQSQIFYVTENYKDDEYFGHSEEKGEDGILKWERDYVNNQTYSHKSIIQTEKYM